MQYENVSLNNTEIASCYVFRRILISVCPLGRALGFGARERSERVTARRQPRRQRSRRLVYKPSARLTAIFIFRPVFCSVFARQNRPLRSGFELLLSCFFRPNGWNAVYIMPIISIICRGNICIKIYYRNIESCVIPFDFDRTPLLGRSLEKD